MSKAEEEYLEGLRRRLGNLGGLGDLAEPLKTERGERLARETSALRGSAIPADMQRQAGFPGFDFGNFDQLRPPELNVGPDPVYQTLPANGVKVVLDGEVTSAWPFSDPVDVITYTVPIGRVHVLRRVSLVVKNTTTAGSGNQLGIGLFDVNGLLVDFTFSVRVNEAITGEMDQIIFDPFGDQFPLYVIAKDGDIVSVRIFPVDYQDGAALIENQTFLAQLNIDELLTNELPATYNPLKRPDK